MYTYTQRDMYVHTKCGVQVSLGVSGDFDVDWLIKLTKIDL